MPYKDPEKRRQYDRDYQKHRRAQQALTKAQPPPGRKAYLCLKEPHRRWGGIAFVDGWFITADPEQQAAIEADPAYGQWIFSWRLEP